MTKHSLHGLLVLVLIGLAGCAAEKADGRPWVHDIRFLGTKHISTRDLASKLGVQQTSWIPFARKHYLEPYAIPLERERIEAYYRDHGYFDAKVTSAVVKPRKHASVDIEYKIDEGTPTKITQIKVDGLEQLGPIADKLRHRLTLKPGQIFDHERYLGEKGLLSRVIEERGYAWVAVTGEVDVDRGAYVADVHLVAAPGPKARFGSVSVEGNEQIRAIDIIRSADIKAGRDFTPKELEEARAQIYNLGVFGSVRLSYDHDPVDPSIADVKVSVREAQFHELRLGGGFGIEAQRNDVHLIGSYTRRNFLGGLRVITLSLEPAFVIFPAVWDIRGTNSVRYGPAATAEVQLTQPFLFNVRNLDLRFTVGYDLGIDYAYQYHGPRTQLGVSYGLWRRRVQLGLSYNFLFLDFFNTVPSILEDPSQAGALYGYVDPYRVGWWQQDLALDLRDSALDPHQGIYLLASFEESGAYAGSAFQYEKIVPDARVYAPLGHRVTLAGRFQYGKIYVQGDLGSPITRRLFLGGPSSHRGFSYNRLAYQVPACPVGSSCPSSISGLPAIPVGGDEMVLMQAEVRVHIVKLLGNWFGAVAFIDGGDVTTPSCSKASPGCAKPLGPNALTHLDFTQLHWAVGGGLRYKTVIGTIRADLGVRVTRLNSPPPGSDLPPTPDPGTRFAFHLSVGEAF